MATDLEMMCSVVTGYYFLGIEIDDKLVVTLSHGKTLVVIG